MQEFNIIIGEVSQAAGLSHSQFERQLTTNSLGQGIKDGQ
jgi:hypothetical protein